MQRLSCLPALALLVSAAAVTAQPAREPATISVTADATRTAVPDVATITAGVVTQAADAAAAMAENNKRMTAVVAAIRRAGVADRDLRTSQIAVQPQYRYGEGRAPAITGYQASNQVTVRLRDMGRIGPVLDSLVKEGANRIEGPSFGLDRPEPLLDEARAEAVSRARARADLLAKAAGVRIVRVLAISEGVQRPEFRPLMRAAVMEMADSPAPPVALGENELRASVTVVYEIE
ncbi:MAG: SIMPL domain-containing protein [Sphingomonadaceae bacterium]